MAPRKRIDEEMAAAAAGGKQDWSKLQELQITNKGVNDIGPWLASLTALQDLSLAFNELVHVSALSKNASLIRLNLSHNKIASLAGLEGLEKLTVLKLNHNELAKVELAGCPAVEELWLASNRIAELADLRALRALPKLQRLVLKPNPVTKEEGYRLGAIGVLPALQVLDGAPVTEQERAEAAEAAQRVVDAIAYKRAEREAGMSHRPRAASTGRALPAHGRRSGPSSRASTALSAGAASDARGGFEASGPLSPSGAPPGTGSSVLSELSAAPAVPPPEAGPPGELPPAASAPTTLAERIAAAIGGLGTAIAAAAAALPSQQPRPPPPPRPRRRPPPPEPAPQWGAAPAPGPSLGEALSDAVARLPTLTRRSRLTAEPPRGPLAPATTRGAGEGARPPSGASEGPAPPPETSFARAREGEAAVGEFVQRYASGVAAVTVRPDGSAVARWPNNALAVVVDAAAGGGFALFASYRGSGALACSFDREGNGFVNRAAGATLLSTNARTGGFVAAPDGGLAAEWGPPEAGGPGPPEVEERLDEHLTFVWRDEAAPGGPPARTLAVLFECGDVRFRLVRGFNLMRDRGGAPGPPRPPKGAPGAKAGRRRGKEGREERGEPGPVGGAEGHEGFLAAIRAAVAELPGLPAPAPPPGPGRPAKARRPAPVPRQAPAPPAEADDDGEPDSVVV